jgi:hypothetical protein
MGLVKKILGLKKIDKISTLYSDYLSVELAEDFHIHLRNLRIEMDGDEFAAYCRAIRKAYLRWRLIGRPKVFDFDEVSKQVFLNLSRIDAEAGKNNDAINSDEIRVELQKWADHIHVHWKSVRLEFDINEFLEFADVINESAAKLKSEVDIESMPRRIGKYHVACPRGRADKKGDGIFWTEKNQTADLNQRHKTIYFDKVDQELKHSKGRKIGNYQKSYKRNLHILFIKIILKIMNRIPGLKIS